MEALLRPEARIVGVDVDDRCADLAEDRVEVRIGDQADRTFLCDLKEDLGPIDIVIDDGAHMFRHQRATFEEIFPAVSAAGVYLVEDLHTGYWPEYGGGVARRTPFGNRRPPKSFIEYSKDLIDALNAWHSRDEARLSVGEFTRTTQGIHYYDSVLVIEKGIVRRPESRKTGTPSFDDGHAPTE